MFYLQGEAIAIIAVFARNQVKRYWCHNPKGQGKNQTGHGSQCMRVGMANNITGAVDRAMSNACSESGKLFVERVKENLK